MHLVNRERQGRCFLLVIHILCAPTASRTRYDTFFYCHFSYTNVLKVNLIVGDYFKVETVYTKHSKMACELISWLRSKTQVLARLRVVQVQSGMQPLSVIRAVLTRWTAHYLAFRRLLQLHRPLTVLVNSDAMALPHQRILVSPGLSASNKRRAQEMVVIIEDGSFWHSLARLKTHLEPLARAANVAQAAFCRLDQILLTFGSLSIYYEDNRARDPANVPGCTAILDSIEKRWAKADQDVFIATVLLNPFIKSSAFDPTIPFLTHAGVYALMKRLYRCFFSVTETTAVLEQNLRKLLVNIEDYFATSGSFAHMASTIVTIEEEAR
ncbi:hypothetical protein EDB83DRAFT_2222872, partial [Lactarius deliciosus]